MSYNVQCDVCPNKVEVGPEGEIPSDWGIVMIEHFPESVNPGGETEIVEEEPRAKGITLKLHLCPVCNEMVYTIGPHNLLDQLQTALCKILVPTEK